jgi:hypothetical protein
MIAVFASNGPRFEAVTVIVFADVSIETTGVFAVEYAVFRTLTCDRNGAAASVLSGWYKVSDQNPIGNPLPFSASGGSVPVTG